MWTVQACSVKPYLKEMYVVLRQSQLAQRGAPLVQLSDLLLQLLQEALSFVLGRPPTHLDHLGQQENVSRR